MQQSRDTYEVMNNTVKSGGGLVEWIQKICDIMD